MTGVRRTASSQKVTVIVEAYHRIAEGEVQQVDFQVTDANGTNTYSVTSRTLTSPDDTDVTDPLPGWAGTGPARIWGFAYDVLMTRPAGTITVSAIVVPSQGTSMTLPPLTVYNHKGGVTPPSTNAIHVEPEDGDDTANGDKFHPVLSIQRACTLARNASGDAGGAHIYLRAGKHLWSRGGQPGSYGQPSVVTSGDHWLTIEPEAGLSRADVTITRQDHEQTSSLAINAPSGSGSYACRLRFRNVVFEGDGVVVENQTNVTTHVWLDGCEERSTFTSSVHVGAQDTSSQAMTVTGGGSITCTGGFRHHVVNGWLGARMLRGCRLENWIGIATQNTANDQGICNLYAEHQRYKSGVAGCRNSEYHSKHYDGSWRN